MTGTYFCKWYFLGILRDVVIARLLKDAEKAFENKDEPKKEEKKDTEEVKKDEPKAEEKKDEAKVDVIEIVEEKKAEEPKVEEVPELDYASKLEKFVEFINWDLKRSWRIMYQVFAI